MKLWPPVVLWISKFCIQIDCRQKAASVFESNTGTKFCIGIELIIPVNYNVVLHWLDPQSWLASSSNQRYLFTSNAAAVCGSIDVFAVQLIIFVSSSCATFCFVCCSIRLCFVLSLVAALFILESHRLWLVTFADFEFLLMADDLIMPDG
jgi:hypothetical protein